MKTFRFLAAGIILTAPLTLTLSSAAQTAPTLGSGPIKHVLLLSIDGMHAVDF